MAQERVAVSLLVGSLAIFLGFSRVLDELVEGIRNFNIIGTPQPVTRQGKPQPVSRFDRLCFVAAGAALIVITLIATIWKH